MLRYNLDVCGPRSPLMVNTACVMDLPNVDRDPYLDLSRQQGKRLRRTVALPPAERLRRFLQLQADVLSTLVSNPRALERFHRRNRQRRCISRAKSLESELRFVADEEA